MMQKICIVIPCYNEEKRLPVKEFDEFLNSADGVNFCFVNDGSTDDTTGVLKKIQANHNDVIHIINLEKNSGKAEAVRQGILGAEKWQAFGFIGFMDADLATPLSEINVFRKHINENPYCTLFLGSRIKRLGSNIKRSVVRHYFGRVFATLASVVLGLGVYDTQCGAKMFHVSVVDKIFSEPFYSRWLFDIEFIFRALNYYGKDEALKKIVEVPLQNWVEKGKSKVSPFYALKVPFVLFKIKRQYNKLNK